MSKKINKKKAESGRGYTLTDEDIAESLRRAYTVLDRSDQNEVVAVGRAGLLEAFDGVIQSIYDPDFMAECKQLFVDAFSLTIYNFVIKKHKEGKKMEEIVEEAEKKFPNLIHDAFEW